MSWQISLRDTLPNCKLHTRDDGFWCGPACEMMILAALGVDPAGLMQGSLYLQGATLYTEPETLRDKINERLPTGSGHYSVNAGTSAEEGTRLILQSLLNGRPAAALVQKDDHQDGCLHWVTVVGMVTDRAPESGRYHVTQMILNNPVWFVRHTNPAHENGDNCGTGDAGIGLGATETDAYTQWTRLYFLGCRQYSAAKPYITVGDMGTHSVSAPLKSPQRGDGSRFLFGEDVVNAVLDEVQAAPALPGLVSLANSRIGHPLLVHRLDIQSGASDYYLASVTDPTHTQVRALALVEGHDRSARAMFRPEKPTKRWLITRAEIKSAVIGDAVRRGLHATGPGAQGVVPMVDPDLYWRPCVESTSPFLPFFRVRYLGATFFVRIDGLFIRTELRAGGRGL